MGNDRMRRVLGKLSLVQGTATQEEPTPLVSTRQAVFEALSLNGQMRAKDIVEQVVARPDVDLHGKTPRKSVEARLAEGVARGELVKVKRGVYKVARKSSARAQAQATG